MVISFSMKCIIKIIVCFVNQFSFIVLQEDDGGR